MKKKKITQVFERAKIFYLLYFLYKTSNKIFEIMGKNKSNKNIYFLVLYYNLRAKSSKYFVLYTGNKNIYLVYLAY